MYFLCYLTGSSITLYDNFVRLANGNASSQGRVEIWHSGQWNTVCDDGWGLEEATVVCRQLGYSSAESAPCCASFGQGTGQIILDDLGCSGSESSLLSCPHSGLYVENCGHSQDAGVVCKLLFLSYLIEKYMIEL